MPPVVYERTFAIPATWLIEILRGLVLRGASAPELLHSIAPLAAIGVAVSVLVAVRFQRYRA